MSTRLFLLTITLFTTGAAFAEDDDLPILFCSNKIQITGAGPVAKVEICPLYRDTAWAIGSRWDDSNTEADEQMAQMMDRHGYKATFYLHGNGLPVNVEQALLARGHGFASHTISHPFLPSCSYNRIQDELLRQRINMEAKLNAPVNSFSFSFNDINYGARPNIQWDLYRQLRRAGYVHVALNYFLTPGMKNLSQTLQPPGDGAVSEAGVDELFKQDNLRQTEPMVCFNTHAGAYQGKDNPASLRLESILKKYAHRSDFWYPTLTEYGGYRFQYKLARIENLKNDSGAISFTLTRPSSVDSNTAVPLSLRLVTPEGKNARITCDGKPLSPDTTTPKAVVFSVPCPPPASTIDAVTVEAKPVASSEFPYLTTSMALAPDEKSLSLRLENRGPAIRNVVITYRLPFTAHPGVQRKQAPMIEKSPFADTIPITWLDRSERYLEGWSMFVAQVDFLAGTKPCRLYVLTLKQMTPSDPGSTPSDHFLWCGPAASDAEAAGLAAAIVKNPAGPYILPGGKKTTWEPTPSDYQRNSGEFIIAQPNAFLCSQIQSSTVQTVKLLVEGHHQVWINSKIYAAGNPVPLNQGLNSILIWANNHVYLDLLSPQTGKHATGFKYIRPVFQPSKPVTVEAGVATRVFLRDWLVCGPFPNPGTRPVKLCFDVDYLASAGGEKAITPDLGTTITWDGKKIPFQLFHSGQDRVDLLSFPSIKSRPQVEDLIAYATGYITSDQDREVLFGIGSDDGYKLYLNHQLTARVRAFRGAATDQEVYKVKLNKGLNSIVLKVDQDFGQYEFYLSVSTPYGTPLTGIKFHSTPSGQ